MASDAKERIRERLGLAEVVGEFVALKPAGRGQLKGLCPFHDEKTPSFHVHQDRGFYYCFGCQAKGDIFDFVMQTRSMSFPEALKLLGDRAGVEVGPPSPKAGHRRDLFDVNQVALDYFRTQLAGPALEYLEGRGLTRETIDAFELGYAPDAWDGLLKVALTKGVNDADLVTLGLVVENERGRRYDRFRGRVMFPIRDALGRLVGFAGRVLGDGQPKYLNSPESELFKKGELLYGLDRARSEVREQGEALVVEGYMDVIALHQAGFLTAVASLGTALTAAHADALARLDVRRLYLAFDSDEAGQRAILTGLDQTAARRFLVRAVTVPHGKDPADAVLGGHAEEFRAALSGGLSEVEFRFNRILERHDKNQLDGQRAILEELQSVLRPRDVFDPVATEMRRLVTQHLGLDAGRLDEWLARTGGRGTSLTEMQGLRRRRPQLGQMRRLELEVIALALLEPRQLHQRVQLVAEEFAYDQPDTALGRFVELARATDYNVDALLAAYAEQDEGSVVFERLFGGHDDEGTRIDVEDQLRKSLSRLREFQLEGQKEETRTRLSARRDELTKLLAADGLSQEELEGIYGELQEIQAMLAARDAERRLRVPAAYSRRRRR